MILALSTGAAQAAVVTLEILDYATGSSQIANTSTDVPLGSTAANFAVYNSGDSIIFNMGDANTAISRM